jgi:hypothetical protein
VIVDVMSELVSTTEAVSLAVTDNVDVVIELALNVVVSMFNVDILKLEIFITLMYSTVIVEALIELVSISGDVSLLTAIVDA